MCGIAGILDLDGVIPAREGLSRMLDHLVHRGPDDRGEEELRTSAGSKIHLGHTRLSIIDLSSGGHQPMFNNDRALVVSSNSEIYNYKTLREELGNEHQFVSESDTEVLLKSWQTWGPESLPRLHGMFGFAVCDLDKNTVYLARDRLGVKPLYFYEGSGFILFASEIRALLASGQISRRINPTGLYHYLAFGCSQGPASLVQGIKEVKPGHFLKISTQTGKIEEHCYWSPLHGEVFTDRESHQRELSQTIHNAVDLRLISDRPLGSFLSGGIDSSAVSGLMASIKPDCVKTLAVGFNESEFDESRFSRTIADQFQLDHQIIHQDEAGLLSALPRILESMDQPTVDGVNTWIISRAARELGLTVALSGVGGDELFGGYDSFRLLPGLIRRTGWIKSLPRPLQLLAGGLIETLLGASDKTTKMSHLVSQRLGGAHLFFLFRALFCEGDVCRLFQDSRTAQAEITRFYVESEHTLDQIKHRSEIDKISWLELTQYATPMLLRDTDMMSMAHGLEVRVPLMDHKLVELMFRTPSGWKLSPKKAKPLLQKALPFNLPPEITRRSKMGFTFPFEHWMRTSLRSQVEEVIRYPSPSLEGVLSQTAVERVWEQFLAGEVSWSRPWSLYVLKHWANQHLEAV